MLDVLARLFDGPRSRFDHVLNPQIFAVDNGVVFADVSGDFSQMVAADVGDAFVKTGNLRLLFFPIFTKFRNGGVALADIANYYLGAAGNVVLCLMIFFACLTTSIGLTASAASYFTKVTHEQVQYQRFVVAICVFSFAVSNVGLTNIISFSIPILCALYPIIIALVLLGVTSKLFHGDKRVYRCCLFFTTIFALLDGLKAAGIKLSALETILGNTIPLYADGFGWIVPSVCGALLGLLWKLLVPAQTK